jgi:hypothetical protein
MKRVSKQAWAMRRLLKEWLLMSLKVEEFQTIA